ncbi:hypothetical protein GSI_11155 [Ganoderma sinense ZZ0214-1]|uniref:Uncharacterized protein n=1 Tax=Ganoderma sinense ZZ0214-1 TaxID=1077348 RepID=A0A2G8RYZ4_9APHY|nr:hypothetical protein GSI_11155 [Ganoderma sinense ZZ0214-1]
MIVENSASRDSKRNQNGFPVVCHPDTSSRDDKLVAGPSNEPPPPTYEEAVSIMEASSSAHATMSTSSGGFAPSRSSSNYGTATSQSQEKHAPQADTSTLSPYANPAVTGYGVSAQSLSSGPETSLGRHSSVASYYAPSTSSGKSRPDSGFASSFTTSSSSSGDSGASLSIARSSSTSTTHTSSSCASNPSQPDSPSDRGAPSPAHPQSQPSTSTRAASFARAPENDLPYGAFPPATLHAYSDDLEADGFPKDPPTCACAPAPHPFVTHDVSEEDWASFLDDVRGAGGLSPVNGLIAGAAPIAVRAGIIGGIIAGHALRAHMKSKRKSPVADKFFHPRCMDVVLAQGTIPYTGPAKAVPPDMAWRARENGTGKHVKAYEDTSDDENGYSSREIPGMAAVASAGRQLGRLDSTVKGRGTCSRIALSRDLKASAGERWRLVVSYNPPVL